jgi:geranylgeranyl pyrophosphate synthase
MQRLSLNGIMETTTITFFDLIRSKLSEVERQMRISPGEHDPNLIAALDHILSSGGKRIRPALVLLSAGMLDANRDHAIKLAASVEMLHTATLVHDDLIDGASLRRGTPTINATLGPGATVLTGDYIFARAAFLAAEIGQQELMKIFARTLMTIVNGEISQMYVTGSSDGGIPAYLERIYAKTASLFEVATEGAAILSEIDEDTIATMKSFGYNIGMAFQIVDDILDFTENQDRLGKPAASDLRQGLITLPVLYYLSTISNKDELSSKITERRCDDAELAELASAIRSSDAIEQALNQAQEFITTGMSLLKNMPANQERAALFELSEYIINRNT